MSEIIDMDYLIDNIYSLNLKKVLKKYKLMQKYLVKINYKKLMNNNNQHQEKNHCANYQKLNIISIKS